MGSSGRWNLLVLMVMGGTLLSGIVSFLMHRRPPNRNEGTLEVNCTNRCKFQGMECMPGGSWGSTMPAGDYTFEVFDASSPTHWTSRVVTIRNGEKTSFACTPR